MSLNGRQLQYFITIADSGSLGRAAQVLHIAQPALSRQIRLLEESVGTSLMERTAQGMRLTPAGKAYYGSARQLLNDDLIATAHALRVSNGAFGQLRLGFSEIYAWHPDVLSALRAYKRDSPDVSFTIEAMLSGVVVQRVMDGQLDVALAFTGDLAKDSPLDCQPWRVDQYLLALHEESALAKWSSKRLDKLKLADLNEQDFIMFRRDQSPRLHDLMIHHFYQQGFTPRVVQEGTTHYTVLGLVAAGLGCAIVPASAAGRLPMGVKLIAVSDLDIRMPINLVWRKDNNSPLIQRFAKILI